MKEYKRHVLWLDYFDSSLSREGGRHIPLDRAVKNPKLDELAEAAKSLGYSPEATVVKHPKRMSVESGSISIEKRTGLRKAGVLLQVAKALAGVRGKRATQGATADHRAGKSVNTPQKHGHKD